MEPSWPDPLQRWRDARDQLDRATHHYLESTLALQTAISDPINHSINPSHLEKIILEANYDASSILSRTQSLKKAQFTLNQIRNLSTILIPINRLPPELLFLIFHTCTWKSSCGRYDPSMPHFAQHYFPKTLFTLSHVCSRWRSIIVRTPSFWAHVSLKSSAAKDFINSCKRLQISFQRAQNLPLCIEFEGQTTLPTRSLDTIAACLRPHLANLRFLQLINFWDHEVLLKFISFWLTHGRPGAVRTLVVWLNGDVRRRYGLFPTNSALSRQHIDSHLLPIRVLRLNGVHFDWDSAVYRNLVMLQVGSLHKLVSPTIHEMLDILAACPHLHTLQLYNMSILDGGRSGRAALKPVTLNELKVLDLLHMDSEGLCLLLPMVYPHSGELSVRVSLHPSPTDAASAICTFLARNNVTRLYISRPEHVNARGLHQYLVAVPNLNTLILDLGWRPGDSVLENITCLPPTSTTRSNDASTLPQRIATCPKLHTLYLIRGSLRNTTVQESVLAHPHLRKLRFASCFLEPFDEELLYWLKPIVKDVRCEIRLDNAKSLYWYLFMS